jgi:TonB family protein
MVQDASKTPVDGARLTLMPLSKGKPLQTSSNNGLYSFPEVPKGEYILTVEKTSFGMVFGAVRLPDDDQHQLGFVLEVADLGIVKTAPPHRKPYAKTEASTSKPKIEQAHLLRKVDPVFPAPARKARISGTVLMEVELGVDGTLNDLVVLSAPSPDLAIAALVAVQKWRYSPVRAGGKPVPAITVVDVNFQL